MSKRYAFWRKPNGRPAETGSKYAPIEILAEYGSKSTITKEGHINWSTFFSSHLETALRSISVIISPNGEELNDRDTWQIIWTSLIDTIKKTGGGKPLKESDVLKIADEKAAEFFRKTEKHYALISSLSISLFPGKSIKIKDCRIYPITSRKKYPCPEHVRSYPVLDKHIKTTKYQLVKVLTSGRSVHEAAHHGLDNLNLLRGLWSLFSTYGSWTISFGGPREKPIGIIHNGPIHTLHYRDGKLADDRVFWYERGLNEDYALFSPNAEKWKKIEADRRWAMRQINRLPFRYEVEQLICRYAIALDQSDLNVAFLQMWSILETLTDTIGNYDETVRRAIWPYQDRGVNKEILECMRSRRNLYVHTARTGEDADQAIYLIKGFVDVHFIRLIRNYINAGTIEEYARHLSLSPDVETLRREKNLISKAIYMLTLKSKK